MLGLNALKEAERLHKVKRIPLSYINTLLDLDDIMNYRTCFDIVKADCKGLHTVTRPEWLKDEPAVQKSPDGWELINGFTDKGYWAYFEPKRKGN